jgi:hypothetical protein
MLVDMTDANREADRLPKGADHQGIEHWAQRGVEEFAEREAAEAAEQELTAGGSPEPT